MKSIYSITYNNRFWRIFIFAIITYSGFVTSGYGAESTQHTWAADQGDTYRNPIIYADYSDPDVTRAGDDYYMVSSSFLAVPGIPVLHSRDLVNWELINHVLKQQIPEEHFEKPRHGEGVWAPSIRYHDGKFWVFYPDPDYGIYLSTAEDPAGEWSEPVLVMGGKGLIDPCPLWDDDGTLYMIYAWAHSRSGISNVLTLCELSPDGTKPITEGKTIIDASSLDGWIFLEGPKLYKRDGYYYVFAPAGGVATGYQAVFRSREIYGPYEEKIVLHQGETQINGPHQGAWVDTASGEDWFFHFQSLEPYGRIVHLQPMKWLDNGWPVMGVDEDGDGTGEPVLSYRKPNTKFSSKIKNSQTSDLFDADTLALQWQWNANPESDWASLEARPGFLRLKSVAAPAKRNDGTPAGNSLYDLPNFLLQKFAAPAFFATTQLEFEPQSNGEQAGLVVFGESYAWIGLKRSAGKTRLVYSVNDVAKAVGAQEREIASVAAASDLVQLRVEVQSGGECRFFYSFDGKRFLSIGDSFQAVGDRWIGAKVGLFAISSSKSKKNGYADFAHFLIDRLVPEESN